MLRILRVLLITMVGSVTLTTSSQGETLRVTQVPSGDSIVVVRQNEPVSYRIRGVRCLPVDTYDGRKAQRYTSALISKKMVELELIGLDSKGIKVARVLVDGRDIALDLIRAGLAKHDWRTAPDQELADAQSVAQSAALGIWSAETDTSEDEPPIVLKAPASTDTGTGELEPREYTFKKIKFVRFENDKRKEKDAILVIGLDQIVVTDKKGKEEYSSFPFYVVEEITYERSSHPRWESVAMPTVFGPFGNRKKHWLTFISDTEGENEYVLLRLDKDNYSEIIAALESRLDIGVRRIVEFEAPKY